MRRPLAALLSAVLLCACGGGPAGTTTPSSARQQQPRSSARILTHGDDEQFVARYDLAGRGPFVEHMHMEMAMAMTIGPNSVPRMELPGMDFDVQFARVERDASGNFVLRFRSGAVSLVGTGDLPADAIAGLRASLAPLADVSGTYVISPRGDLVSFDLEVPDDMPEATRTQLEQMQQSMGELVLVWPEEAIGVGTVFEVEKTVHSGGVESRQTTRYRVVGVEGSVVTLEILVRITADPQRMASPAAAPDTRVELRSMTGTGSGRSRVDLTSVVVDATSESHVELEAVVTTPDGATTEMSTQLDMAIRAR